MKEVSLEVISLFSKYQVTIALGCAVCSQSNLYSSLYITFFTGSTVLINFGSSVKNVE